MKYGGILVSYACKFIETTTSEDAQSSKVGMKMLVDFWRQVEREKLLKAGISSEKILTRSVRRHR